MKLFVSLAETVLEVGGKMPSFLETLGLGSGQAVGGYLAHQPDAMLLAQQANAQWQRQLRPVCIHSNCPTCKCDQGGMMGKRLEEIIQQIELDVHAWNKNIIDIKTYHKKKRDNILAIKTLVKEIVPKKGIKGGQYGLGWDDAIDQILDKLEEL